MIAVTALSLQFYGEWVSVVTAFEVSWEFFGRFDFFCYLFYIFHVFLFLVLYFIVYVLFVLTIFFSMTKIFVGVGAGKESEFTEL